MAGRVPSATTDPSYCASLFFVLFLKHCDTQVLKRTPGPTAYLKDAYIRHMCNKGV